MLDMEFVLGALMIALFAVVIGALVVASLDGEDD